MEEFTEATKANIDCCNHSFCFECIKEWADKSSNNCPICKFKFQKITRVNEAGETEETKVKDKNLSKEPNCVFCDQPCRHAGES